jgi:hypothetical protein
MVYLYANDERNYLLLTEGYLPAISSILNAWPKNPAFLRTPRPSFQSREEAMAIVMRAAARRMAYYRRYEYSSVETAMSVPFDTWVISPDSASKARFAPWFRDEPADTTYRIVIHRHPYLGDASTPFIWTALYRGIAKRRLFDLKHKKIDHETKQQAKSFLGEMLDRYRHGVIQVEDLVESTGHPYGFVWDGGNSWRSKL